MRAFITIAALLCFFAYTPVNFATINKIYDPESYREDIDQLVTSVKENHPRPFMFISEKEFNQLVDTKKNEITSKTTYGQFIWDMSEILASIGCGHSSFRYYFIQEDNILPTNSRFPMDVKVFGDRLYITDPLINSKNLSKGQEILTINGKDTQVILSDIYTHIFADANLKGSKRFNFNVFANSYLAYYFDLTNTYSVKVSGNKDEVRLTMLTDYKHKPMISPKDGCQDQLCLEFINSNTAKLTVRTFNYYGERSKIFEEFIDKSFAEIKARKPQNLIVDIRGNGGGNSFSAAYLLAHIADKEFIFYKEYAPGAERLKQPIEPYPNAYHGDVYVITDGSDGSSAGFFLSLAKSNSFAVIIGDDSGSSFSTNAGYKDHELRNTGIKYRVSTVIMDTNVDGLIYGKPIKPDYRAVQSIDDYLNNKDTILDFTIQMINSKN